MGLFGNRTGLSAAQQVARGGDGVDPSTARPMAFEQGGMGRNIVGYVGDALLNMSGNKPVYAPAMQDQRQQASELQRQIMLAQWKAANPDPTGTMQNVQDAGFKRGTPEYQAFMRRAIMAPKVVGVPGEGGATDYMDFNQMGGPDAAAAPAPPQPGAVQDGYVFLGGDPSNVASWRKQ